MRAFFDDQENLSLVLSGETPEELLEFKTIQELVSVYLPKLEIVNPLEIGAKTSAPIFKFQNKLWYLPNYLVVDPLEHLRDNGWLKLQIVR